MEDFKQKENLEEDADKKLSFLIEKLSEILDTDLSVENVDGTYEIDDQLFSLTFTLSDDIFEIRNIDTHGNSGIGSDIVEAIHEYADNDGLEVIASNVLDTAPGFWKKMGYEEGGEESEFFRVG